MVLPDLTARRTCPRCDAATIVALGFIQSTLPWFQCVQCRLVWPQRVGQPQAFELRADGCPRCGAVLSGDVASAGTSGLKLRRCDECGHVSAVTRPLES